MNGSDASPTTPDEAEAVLDLEPEAREPSKLGGLFKHSVIYSAAPLFRQVISIAMTRFYTSEKWLGTAGYGVKEIVDLWLIALQQLLGQNVLGSMVRFYYDRQDERERARVVTSCTILVSIVAWIVCGTAFFFRGELLTVIFKSGGEVGEGTLLRIIAVALILIPLQLSTLSGFYYLQALKRSNAFTTIQTAKLLFEVALNFVLIGGMGLGVYGFLLSMVAGEALTSIFLVGWMIRRLGWHFDARILRPILVYAAPLIPVGLCQLAMHQMDRSLILHLLPEENGQTVTGIYGLGYRVGYLVNAMMLGPFLQIFQPWVFGIEDPKERAQQVARVSTYAVLTLSAASLGIILFGRQAAIVLAKEEAFWEAYRVIPFVGTGYVFWALYQASQLPLFIAKRTGRLLGINLVAVLVNLGLNLWLIPIYGMVGAAIATAVTFASLAALGMIASRSEAHVPFELDRIGTTIVCVIAGALCARWIDGLEASDQLGVMAALGCKAAILLLLTGVLYRLVLRPSERTEFTRWTAGRLGR